MVDACSLVAEKLSLLSQNHEILLDSVDYRNFISIFWVHILFIYFFNFGKGCKMILLLVLV